MTVKYYLSNTAKQLRTDGEQFLIAPRPGDSGYDLASAEDTIIYKGTRHTVRTGVHVAIPKGYVGIIKDRSSMASLGIHVLAGVIDSSYRGEIRVILINHGEAYARIHPFDKIAQMIIIPYLDLYIEEVDGLAELGDTVRGQGGFGSTGK
jgi:dUTP pyrophosphatase